MIDRVDPFSAQRESRLLQVLRHLGRGEAVQQRLLLVAQSLLLEARADARLEQHRIDGLGQVVLGTQLDAAHDALDPFERGRDDDGQVAQLQVVLQLLEYLEAVHLRHLHVEQEQVERFAPKHLERDAAVLRGRDAVTLLLQAARQEQPVDLVVVDDEQPGAAASALTHCLSSVNAAATRAYSCSERVERRAVRRDRGGEPGQLEFLRLRGQSERAERVAVGLQRMGGAPEGVGVTGREGAAQVASIAGASTRKVSTSSPTNSAPAVSLRSSKVADRSSVAVMSSFLAGLSHG